MTHNTERGHSCPQQAEAARHAYDLAAARQARAPELASRRTVRSLSFLGCLLLIALPAASLPVRAQWPTASPESAGFDPGKLEMLWKNLAERKTTALLLIRHDQIVFERYAPGATRHTPHYTASLAKALVGGLGLILALDDGCVRPDDPAAKFVPSWTGDATKANITIRSLATHTSGIEDAEADGIAHDKLSGWKGDFWKRLEPPRDPFTLARDVAPVLDPPGTRARYSNPGMAMLSYCLTASRRGETNSDLRSLLRRRILEPLGVPEKEWSVGYGRASRVDGLELVADWGGAAFTPDATARIGKLLLHQGEWPGKRLLSAASVAMATHHAHMPNNSGLGWWINRELNGSKHWRGAPMDAFWGAGAGHQLLLIIPSLELIVVRYGELLDRSLSFDSGLEQRLIEPLMAAFHPSDCSVHQASPVIHAITWAHKESIVRRARGGDNWPLTWGDDDQLYTAYGDGSGFEPHIPAKLSLGFAKVLGIPPEFTGLNLRSATGEQLGDGRSGRKASGLLMLDRVLYLWARNATNSQLAWSGDHGQTWTWSNWRFTTSFGCPTFLNFGRNYSGARDAFVYIYSPDSDRAYEAADRFVLARVPKDRLPQREQYQFFKQLDAGGQPVWTDEIEQRGAIFAAPGQCYRSSISYNAPLKRYLWCQTLPGADPRFKGGFAIYDAPEPWGPWTEAFYVDNWDVGPGESSSFPTKWIAAAGTTLWLVFSGEDSFSVRRANIEAGTERRDAAMDHSPERLRVIIETDVGGDPDDEQSLVRFLLYSNEWDVEGIIANRPVAREKENLNRERTGLGIVRAQLHSYAQCYPHLRDNDPRYPDPDRLLRCTVPGYEDSSEAVELILRAAAKPDSRPIWFCNWGTDHGSASSNLKRALDKALREDGVGAYALLKQRFRLSSADAFGDHTTKLQPPWTFWVDTFRPEIKGRRWYHRFSAPTATAGGFEVERDVRTDHGPLGSLYPTNTTHPQKEGDTMSFLYLVPTGMNDPNQPGWGSWAGRYGLNTNFSGCAYYWANQEDNWRGSRNRDNTLARWAVDLQNDFRTRLNWCVRDYQDANHPPRAVLNGDTSQAILRSVTRARSGQTVQLSAEGSSDPDGDALSYEWTIYSEAGGYRGADARLESPHAASAQLHLPADLGDSELHVILAVRDQGQPPLARYRRLIVTAEKKH